MLSEAQMRRRGSLKWDVPAGVLGMAGAEADVRVAVPVTDALAAAARRSDLATVSGALQNELFDEFAAFAARRWAWRCEPSGMMLAPSVTLALTGVMEAVLPARSKVAYSSPVYRPFKDLPGRSGHLPLDVPLARKHGSWRLDLEAISAAFADPDVRGYMLCHPHNPIGVAHPTQDMAALAALAAEHGVVVISDEAHAPLARGAFQPFLAASADAAASGWAVTTAAKAWNLGGAKCAIAVPGSASPTPQSQLASAAARLRWETGRLSVIAAVACYRVGEPWLENFNALLEDRLSKVTVAARSAGMIPAATDAGHLLWIDCTNTTFGGNPADALRSGGIAVVPGVRFGPGGAGHVRLNYAASDEVLREALRRLAAM